MITILLKGGLGNQMFQTAFGCALAQKHRERVKVNRWLLQKRGKGVTPRSYELNRFHLSERFNWIEEVSDAEISIRLALGKVARKVSMGGAVGYYTDLDATDIWRTDFNASGCLLDGYWQMATYVDANAALMRSIFTFGPFESQEVRAAAARLEADNSAIALSVRRSDYISNPTAARVHGTMRINYYEDALLMMRSRGGGKAYIFSDDEEFATQLSRKLTNCEMVGLSSYGTDYFAKFYLMTRCRHHIAANSTYSWWAAWLRRDTSGGVILPRQWFVNQTIAPALISRGWSCV